MPPTRLMVLLAGLLLFTASPALAQERDVKDAPACVHCGMDRTRFAHTRMLVVYEDGTRVGTCSLHCLALDLVINSDRTPVSIQVGDYTTKRLIDAETAFWVKGGSRPGVMTSPGLWAFGSKVYADKYLRERGGTPITFEQALQAAYENMYTVARMLRNQRGLHQSKQDAAREFPVQPEAADPIKRRHQVIPPTN